MMDHLDIPSLFTDEAWQRCFTAFLDHIFDMSHSKQSVYSYRGTLVRFFGACPDKTPERYARADIEEFLHRNSTSKRNPGATVTTATVNSRIAVLKSWYAWCIDWTVEGEDGQPVPLLPITFRSPVKGIHAGKPARVYRALSEDELTRLFSVIPTTMADGSPDVRGARNRACLLFYFLSGRRRAEIQRLVWSDISEAYYPDGKGSMRKGYVYRFYGKGHSTQQDAAELPAMAAQALFHYLEVSGRLATMKPSSPLFTPLGPPVGGKPIDPNVPLSSFTISYFLKRYCKAAGIDERRVTIHSFRHSAAQQRLAQGADLLELMRFLRHQDVSTTMVYIQTLQGSEDHRASQIEAKFAHLLQ